PWPSPLSAAYGARPTSTRTSPRTSAVPRCPSGSCPPATGAHARASTIMAALDIPTIRRLLRLLETRKGGDGRRLPGAEVREDNRPPASSPSDEGARATAGASPTASHDDVAGDDRRRGEVREETRTPVGPGPSSRFHCGSRTIHPVHRGTLQHPARRRRRRLAEAQIRPRARRICSSVLLYSTSNAEVPSCRCLRRARASRSISSSTSRCFFI